MKNCLLIMFMFLAPLLYGQSKLIIVNSLGQKVELDLLETKITFSEDNDIIFWEKDNNPIVFKADDVPVLDISEISTSIEIPIDERDENIYIEKNKLYYRYDESMKNKKAFIFNSSGQMVSVYVLNENSYSLEALSPGVYYIKIQNGQTFKFVKK